MATAVEPREHTIEARGLRFHYVEWGAPDAPAIVLLHGVTSMCRIWDRFASAMQDRYRLIAVDQRGHGETSWPEQPDYAADDFAGDLEALVDLWGLDRFGLIGLSMGGMNAMAYAARHPERVTHLVVVDIPPSVNRALDQPARLIDRHVAKHGYPEFDNYQAALKLVRLSNTTTPDDAMLHRLHHQMKALPNGKLTYRQDPRVSYHWQPANLWDELPKIRAPVLIVRGGRTYALTARTAERMRAAFPNAELVIIEEAGHTVPEDTPEEFNQAVADFLSRYPVT